MTHNLPCFVAHRGFPALYPENSLPGIQAAVKAGARYVEVDIQLSRQLTPYLCHDDNLDRLTGNNACLTELSDDEIDVLQVPYPASSAHSIDTSAPPPIPRLTEFCSYLAQHPKVTAFIEIKAESIARFGLNQTLNAILPVIDPVRKQCVLISFDWELIALVKSRQQYNTGWIIEDWTDEQSVMATRLQPDYLFSSIRCLPERLDQLWPGPWQWVIYTVDDYQTALNYAQAGITLIETDTIGTMLPPLPSVPSATRHYDIVIIGGGIQGVAVAQAAAASGHSVLVLEKIALAAGTSSRSSKLIHGGLRYLESGQFGLVRESLKERTELLRLAPSLVSLQPFHIPVYDQTSRDALTIRAGLSLYALLAGLSKGAGFHSIPRSGWSALDGLSTRGLKHVFQYWDAQTDDQALTRAIMHSASTLGAELRCPAEFIQANISGDICEIEFQENGQTHQCTASALVNAAGPWINQVAKRISPAPPSMPVELVQGTHLILEGKLGKGCYYLESPQDRRAIFALSWKQHILLGTTETVFEGEPERAHPLAPEEAYLLGCFRYYFPDHDAIVRERFAGLRVLPASHSSPFSRSRETHLQCDSLHTPRVVGIYGGKLTVCRATARKVLHTLRLSLPTRVHKADISQLSLELP